MIPVPSIFDDDPGSVAIGPGGSLVIAITGLPDHLEARCYRPPRSIGINFDARKSQHSSVDVFVGVNARAPIRPS
jgi:hypothetical protein